jgi:hypothetical protein
MRPLKLIVSLAAAVCTFVTVNASAQQGIITNSVTFSATTFTQGGTNDNGTITTYTNAAVSSHSTIQILQELSNDIGPFTRAAKLVLLTGQAGADFAVIDGTNFYDIGGSNIMTLSFPGENRIRSGKTSDVNPGVRSPSTTDIQLITLNFDDTSVGGSLTFTLTGVLNVTQTDTTPVNSTYTETVKAKVINMVGEGSGGGNTVGANPFVATGTLTVTGKGTLTIVH